MTWGRCPKSPWPCVPHVPHVHPSLCPSHPFLQYPQCPCAPCPLSLVSMCPPCPVSMCPPCHPLSHVLMSLLSPCPHIGVPHVPVSPVAPMSPLPMYTAVFSPFPLLSPHPGSWPLGGVTGGHRTPSPSAVPPRSLRPRGGAMRLGAPRGSEPLCTALCPALWRPFPERTKRVAMRGGGQAAERERRFHSRGLTAA